MNGSSKKNRMQDPMFARVRPRPKKAVQAPPNSGGRSTFKTLAILLGVAGLFAVLFGVWTKIENLTENLESSQKHLQIVTEDLTASKQEIGSLNEGLKVSDSRLSDQTTELNRYKSLHKQLKKQTETLRSEQAQQTREIEALELEKANQADVRALESTAEEIQGRVSETSSQVSHLRDLTARNREDLELARKDVGVLEGKVASNSSGIDDIRIDLATERFNFELREKGSIMKVFDVSLALKDIDFKKKEYDLDLFLKGERLRKKNQHLNEPIFIYPEGSSKPYQLVVTGLTKQFVTGYLSVPKLMASAGP